VQVFIVHNEVKIGRVVSSILNCMHICVDELFPVDNARVSGFRPLPRNMRSTPRLMKISEYVKCSVQSQVSAKYNYYDSEVL